MLKKDVNELAAWDVDRLLVELSGKKQADKCYNVDLECYKLQFAEHCIKVSDCEIIGTLREVKGLGQLLHKLQRLVPGLKILFEGIVCPVRRLLSEELSERRL